MHLLIFTNIPKMFTTLILSNIMYITKGFHYHKNQYVLPSVQVHMTKITLFHPPLYQNLILGKIFETIRAIYDYRMSQEFTLLFTLIGARGGGGVPVPCFCILVKILNAKNLPIKKMPVCLGLAVKERHK